MLKVKQSFQLVTQSLNCCVFYVIDPALDSFIEDDAGFLILLGLRITPAGQRLRLTHRVIILIKGLLSAWSAIGNPL